MEGNTFYCGWFLFVDNLFDDILYFIFLEESYLIDGTFLIAISVNEFDIFEIINLRNDDFFLEVWYLHRSSGI